MLRIPTLAKKASRPVIEAYYRLRIAQANVWRRMLHAAEATKQEEK